MQEGSAVAGRLTDPASFLASMAAIAADPECATRDSFELADLGRAFERHTGPVRDSAGELIGRIIVVREITAELEAERLKAEISGERDAARLKSELVATVSHELRTPLTSVLGFAELMMHHDIDEETRKRYLQTIHAEAQRLTGLIDDFLDLEKIEAGRFTLALEPFELTELLKHEVELFTMQSASHRLEFDGSEPLAMVGDRNRITQVIANLLSNAIKYSPAGGTVTITATSARGFARVCVSDAGRGHPGRPAGAGLHEVLPRRLLGHARDRWHGPGTRALPGDRRRPRRPDRLREHRGRGQHVLVRVHTLRCRPRGAGDSPLAATGARACS